MHWNVLHLFYWSYGFHVIIVSVPLCILGFGIVPLCSPASIILIFGWCFAFYGLEERHILFLAVLHVGLP